jgi:hypothetical protein
MGRLLVVLALLSCTAGSAFVIDINKSLSLPFPELASVNRTMHLCPAAPSTKKDLSMKGLLKFPDLSNCSAYLTHLDLSDNQIDFIPPEIGTFVNLEELILNNNLIQELPAEIGSLSKLQVLQVNSNQLSTLPASIALLSSLRELQVNANSISELPIEITSIGSLEALFVGLNELTRLPAQLGLLSNLTSLYVAFNMLGEIPAEFGNLENLRYIETAGNPLACLPRAIKRRAGLDEGWVQRPACSNRTVEGFLASHTADKDTCKAIGELHCKCCFTCLLLTCASSTGSPSNETALGCIDYVHTSCSMTATEVMVTTRRLSDLSSEGLSCALDAPQLGAAEVAVYQRCNRETSVVLACIAV